MDLQKQWTRLVGAFFLLVSLIYLIQYAAEHEWFSVQITIAAGMLAGAGIAAAGYSLLLRETQGWKSKIPQWVAELVTGLGISLVYGMLVLAGVRDAYWSPFVIFVFSAILSVAVAAVSFVYQHRLLLNLSAVGALLAPLLMEPHGDQVWTLFLYLLVLNTAVWLVSLSRGWMESRVMMFIGSWAMYTVYYGYYEPVVTAIDSLPFRYATAAFVYFSVVFGIAMFRDWKRWNGLHLYLTAVNATVYALWVQEITGGLEDWYQYAVWTGMGLIYLLSAVVIGWRTGAHAAPVLVNLTGGVLLLIFALNGWFEMSPYAPVVATYVWLMFAVLLAFIGRIRGSDMIELAGGAVWLLTTIYWFSETWGAPRIDFFGVFIPFLNGAALAWIGLAAFGIYLSRRMRGSHVQLDEEMASLFSVVLSVISLVIIGGLLKYQLENLWDAWSLSASNQALSLSVVWALYSIVLMVWGTRARVRLYRFFGTAVLILVALKAIFLDLQSEDSLFKIITFLLLGLIFLGVNAIKEPSVPVSAQAENSVPESVSNRITKDEHREIP